MSKPRNERNAQNLVSLTGPDSTRKEPSPVSPKIDIFSELPDPVKEAAAKATAKSSTTSKDEEKTNANQKYFRCELCNLRMVYSDEKLKEHLTGKEHKCMKLLHDNGLWPGDPGKATTPQKATKLFEFDENNLGVIHCLVCKKETKKATFPNALSLVEHQMTSPHKDAATKQGIGQHFILYYCDLCDMKIGMNAANEYTRHLGHSSHLVNAAEARVKSQKRTAFSLPSRMIDPNAPDQSSSATIPQPDPSPTSTTPSPVKTTPPKSNSQSALDAILASQTPSAIRELKDKKLRETMHKLVDSPEFKKDKTSLNEGSWYTDEIKQFKQHVTKLRKICATSKTRLPEVYREAEMEEKKASKKLKAMIHAAKVKYLKQQGLWDMMDEGGLSDSDSPEPEPPTDPTTTKPDELSDEMLGKLLQKELDQDQAADPQRGFRITLLKQLISQRKQLKSSQSSVDVMVAKLTEKIENRKKAQEVGALSPTPENTMVIPEFVVEQWEQPRMPWIYDPSNPVDHEVIQDEDIDNYFHQLSTMEDAKDDLSREKLQQVEMVKEMVVQEQSIENPEDMEFEDLMNNPEALARLMALARGEERKSEDRSTRSGSGSRYSHRSRDRSRGRRRHSRSGSRDKYRRSRSRSRDQRRSRSRSSDVEKKGGYEIVVENLPEKVDEYDLRQMISKYGDIYEIYVAKDNRNRCKGFAHLFYNTKSDAERCIDAFNGYRFKGGLLKARWAF